MAGCCVRGNEPSGLIGTVNFPRRTLLYGVSEIGSGFCPSISVLPCQCHSANAPYFIITHLLFVIFKKYSWCQKARIKHTNTVSGVCVIYVCHLLLCML